MNVTALSSETIHATTVAIDGRAVLIAGRSGSGKSDLALRLIDRGAKLVSDDYTYVRRADGKLLASAPDTIKGKIEVRGIGITEFESVRDVPLCLCIDLDRVAERLPEAPPPRRIAGMEIPAVALNAAEPSAPIKVEIALRQYGLKLT